MGKGSFKSYVKQINNEIDAVARGRTKEASVYLVGKIKDKLKDKRRSQIGQPPGKRSGDLLRGIKYNITGNETALVGVGPPAQHAHLLEFGTQERHTKSGKYTGRVLRRPFLLSTFLEESDNIRKMMGISWL